jgi:hypothetical protein
MSYRMALRLLYENTGRSGFEAAHQCQLILAHQQYGDPSVLRKIASDMKLMLKKLSSPHFVRCYFATGSQLFPVDSQASTRSSALMDMETTRLILFLTTIPERY